MSLYEDVLKEYYYKPLVEQLNAMVEYRYGPPVPASWYLERGLPLPWVYVPPPWWKRQLQEAKWWLRDKRAAFGHWVGGTRPEQDGWQD